MGDPTNSSVILALTAPLSLIHGGEEGFGRGVGGVWGQFPRFNLPRLPFAPPLTVPRYWGHLVSACSPSLLSPIFEGLSRDTKLPDNPLINFDKPHQHHQFSAWRRLGLDSHSSYLLPKAMHGTFTFFILHSTSEIIWYTIHSRWTLSTHYAWSIRENWFSSIMLTWGVHLRVIPDLTLWCILIVLQIVDALAL